MSPAEFELRRLIHSMTDQHIKMTSSEYQDELFPEEKIFCKGSMKRLRLDIALLFKTMKTLGYLDEEEIAWGAVKIDKNAPLDI